MFIRKSVKESVTEKLIQKYDKNHQKRIHCGVKQVGRFWEKKDGSPQEFEDFCLSNFYAESEKLNKLFTRLEKNFESLYGNFHRVSRQFYWNMHVETGPMLPIDYQFANVNVFAHINDDLFQEKIAFTILLNFPVYSLDEKSSTDLNWSRRKWAETRLADYFNERTPAAVKTKRIRAYVAADDYVNKYNFNMYCLIIDTGERLFPKELILISHWGLRDEIKAQYINEDGLKKQQLIQKVMERVVRQEIPEAVIDSSEWDWNPFTNGIWKAGTKEKGYKEFELNRRYELLGNVFAAEMVVDQYMPDYPSLIARRFNQDREISKETVTDLLISILSAPVVQKTAELIRKRLSRDLQPFDIWYDGFKPKNAKSESELDALVSQKYGSLEIFQNKLPDILIELGFSQKTSNSLASHIRVDPARGAGHAVGAMMREDNAHLRTRTPETGLDYKGFNTAMHELGHTVEQVFSLNEMDFYFLEGVPNTAITEAFAFLFQKRDMNILGVRSDGGESKILQHLSTFWSTYEICGVALVDIGIWDWMYKHPECTKEQVRNAILEIAFEIWNKYYFPVFGIKDQVLLAVYSHIIDCGMYIPDYPLGLIISFQIEEYMKNHDLATEMERMCKLGKLSPQVWMWQAVGEEISTQPMIQAAGKAVDYFNNQ